MTPLRMLSAKSIMFDGDEVRVELNNGEELIIDAMLDVVKLERKSITFLVRGMIADWQITLPLNWQVDIGGKWRHRV